jgi:hypothetical protein
MSGGREREGDAPSRGELTWCRSRIPRTARRGGGGRVTLRSTVTHPSATPSRATPTSYSTLASAWTCERETERDREGAREYKDGPRPRVGIRPCPRGDKGGRFFSPSAWWVQNFRRLLVSVDLSSRYQKSIFGSGCLHQPIPKLTSYLWYRLHLSADIKNIFQMF